MVLEKTMSLEGLFLLVWNMITSWCVCVCVCGPRSPFLSLTLGVCVHRVSVLRGSGVNTKWSLTGNKLSDETLRNYWETQKEKKCVCVGVCVFEIRSVIMSSDIPLVFCFLVCRKVPPRLRPLCAFLCMYSRVCMFSALQTRLCLTRCVCF